MWSRLSIISLVCTCLSMGRAAAEGPPLPQCQPWAASAAFPTANPPGWYTNTYWFAWYYPWYAYYNFSQGPYANWMAGGGFATYGINRPPPAGLPALVTINVPEDATLLFSGVAATGTGPVRAFTTPPLQPNQEYGYELSAEVIRDGKPVKVSKLVIVRPGENVDVKLDLPPLPPPPPKK
jgi:uncharacterized protein (TIGR03000 family)